MKSHLFFVTEGRFIRNDKGVYTQGGFPYRLWERYLSVFERITIVARVKQNGGEVEEVFRSDGPNVSFWDLPYYEGPRDYFRVRHCFNQTIKVIIDSIEKEHASVICRVPGLIGGKIAGLLKKEKKEYACEIVGDPWDVYSPGSLNNPLRPFLRAYFTLQLKRQVSGAKQALYVTESYLQDRYPAKKAVFVTNASNVQIKDAELRPRDSYTGFESTINLLSIGSLDQLYKAPDIVLKAVRELYKSGVICNLVWVGGGRYLNSMVQLAEKLNISRQVRFVGNVDHNSVYNFIRKSDLYLQVSRTEGLPRALIEAMSQGIVCIGTRVGGIPELLNDEVLIHKNSVNELVSCVLKLMNDIELCNSCSHYNLNQSMKYTEKELQAKREAFYKNIVKE